MEEKIFGDTAPSQQIEKTPHWTEFLSLGTGLTLEIDCPVEWGEEGNPYTLLEVANENVALLAFEEVQNRVRTYMQLGFAQGVSDASRITIQRVVLTSTLVHVREDLETAYRVPVWAIFYLSDLDEKMDYPQSVLLINALDGSLVR